MRIEPDVVSTTDLFGLSPDPLQYQNRLRFPQPLESAFRRHDAARSIVMQRQFIIFGFVIFGLFTFLDPLALPHAYLAAWLIRAICEALTVALLGASFQPSIRPHLHWLINAWLLVISGGILTMIMFAQVSELAYTFYPIGLMMVLVCGYVASGHLWYATAQGWLTVLGYGLVAVFGQHMLAGEQSLLKFFTMGFFLITMNLVGMAMGYALEHANRLAFLQWLLINRQNRESNRLLLNVLPASVAERLKRGEVVADHFDEVGILFADIAGFTPYSADKRPAEVVELLNRIFSAFDELTEKYGLEKIKTIGDAYMAVSGLHEGRPQHLRELASMALEMQGVMEELRRDCICGFQLRVGIHAGPVVAGIIGFKKFSYDLWGDTVNVASRMESFGIPGEVQVTKEVYQLLKEDHRFEKRGLVKIKGKGDMYVYLLKGRREDSPRQSYEVEAMAA